MDLLESLEPKNLTGIEKEVYLTNLQSSLEKLSKSMGSEMFVDSNIISYINKIAKTMEMFRYNSGNNIEDNFGIHKSIKIDVRSGFPLIDEFILLSNYCLTKDARLHILNSKESTALKTIDAIMNLPVEQLEQSAKTIDEGQDTIREINFIKNIRNDYLDLPKINTKTRQIELINEDDKAERFNIMYSGWDITKKCPTAYSIIVLDDKEKYLSIGPEKPGQIFKQNSEWVPSQPLEEAIKSSFGLHPQHYFNYFNELKGLHTSSITYFSLEGFESIQSNKHFKDILQKYPDSGILLGTVIKIEAGADKKADLKNSKSQLYVICSDNIKQEVIDYYKHNKNTDFKIVPF